MTGQTKKNWGSKDRKPSAKQIAYIGRLIAEREGIDWPHSSRQASSLYCSLAGIEESEWGRTDRSPTIKQIYGITNLLLKKTRRKWPKHSAGANAMINRLENGS